MLIVGALGVWLLTCAKVPAGNGTLPVQVAIVKTQESKEQDRPKNQEQDPPKKQTGSRKSGEPREPLIQESAQRRSTSPVVISQTEWSGPSTYHTTVSVVIEGNVYAMPVQSHGFKKKKSVTVSNNSNDVQFIELRLDEKTLEMLSVNEVPDFSLFFLKKSDIDLSQMLVNDTEHLNGKLELKPGEIRELSAIISTVPELAIDKRDAFYRLCKEAKIVIMSTSVVAGQ